MRHLLTLFDLTSNEVRNIFAIAEDLKAKFKQGIREPLLPGRVLGLLFDKPSLRTRVSFEAGMSHLGGSTLYLGKDVGWGHRESISDFSQVVSSYLDAIVCRTHAHQRIVDLATHSNCCVINGLTDLDHPCQALTDLFTMKERFGDLKNKKLAFIGDGNNVARSLATCCAHLGVQFSIATPKGYELDSASLTELKKKFPQFAVEATHDPAVAVKGASAVYTDVWTSMGQEEETEHRKQVFRDYQVNGALLTKAPTDAIFLHCLPAHRGEEVTDEVMDSPQSAVFQQAENRMHVQKGVLAWLLGSKSK